MHFGHHTSPTLLLNQKTAAANLEKMAAKAERSGLFFRPHFKTAQSRAVGKLFRERGIRAITVSSLQMAEYFAEDGWSDITIAFPINVREAKRLNALAKKIKLNLLAIHADTIPILSEKISAPVGIFIKIDVGTHRTGIAPENTTAIDGILEKINAAPHFTFRGFLAHAGHSYDARSENEILEVHESSCKILRQLKKKYVGKYPHLILSTGDTPTCSVAENWDGIDEIRPGNFIYYDLTQVQIGSCRIEDIAVAVACPVVAKHPDRQEIIVHGGGIHLSKDRLKVEANGLGLDLSGKTIYGLPVLFEEKGWLPPEPGNFVRSPSQEHGVVSCSSSFFEKIKIGDLLGVLPVHSCMTVNLMPEMWTMEGVKMDLI